MLQTLHRPVSNRGQWRETFTLYADSAPDPATAVYAVQVWPLDGACCGDDYGWPRRQAYETAWGGLSATTSDGTQRLTATAVGTTIVLTWLFPPSQMQALPAGSFEGAVLARIGDEMAEIERFRFVIQSRGGAPSPSLSPSAGMLPGPDIVVIVDGGAEG